MRLKELQLLKYGPFDGQVVRFPGAEPGLHVIFGQNEAGKSSALRALKALLFGISRNTGDDFQFGSDLLSVGAVLQTAGGREFEVQRWKKSPYLRDRTGRAADQSPLLDCLNTLDETSFERFFGLDHDELRRGSDLLLQEKGDVGASIFSAGLSGVDVREILAELDERSEHLFKARASKPAINAAIGDYSKRMRELKEMSVTAKDYREKEEALAKAEEALLKLREKQAALNSSKAKLERIKRTRPVIAKLNDLERGLSALGDVVPLPAGFINERRECSDTLRRLRDELAERSERIRVLTEEIGALSIPENVLEADQAIGELQKELKSYRDARRDMPALTNELKKVTEEASLLLKRLRPGSSLAEVEKLRLRPDQISRIQTLGAQEGELAKAHESQAEYVEELEAVLKNEKDKLAQLAEPRPTERFRSLIAAVQKKGDLEQKFAAETKAVQRLKDEAELALKQLPLWHGTLEQLASLKVPGSEALSDFESRMQKIAAQIETLSLKICEQKKQIADCRDEIAILKKGGEIPTAQQLQAARARRQHGWALIQRAWLKAEDVARDAAAFASLPLPEAFETSIRDADEIADHRYRDVERVGKHEDRLQRIANSECELDKLVTEKNRCTEEHDVLQSLWRQLWAALDIEPGPVPVMREWLARQNQLIQKSEALRLREVERQELLCVIQQSLGSLTQALNECGEFTLGHEPLEELVEKATQFCKEQEKLSQQREKLEDSIEKTFDVWRKKVAARDKARTKLNEWRESWDEAISVLQLRPNALVNEAKSVLQDLHDLFANVDDMPKLEGRIAAMRATVEEFERKTEALCSKIDPALRQLSPDQAVEEFNQRLAKARTDRAQRGEKIKQRDDLAQSDAAAAARIVLLEKRLQEFCATARCETAAELDAIEQRFENQQELNRLRATTKEQLLTVGDGMGCDELVAESAAISANDLQPQLARNASEMADLQSQIDAANDARSKAKSDLDAMNGGNQAAQAAEQVQTVLSQIRNDAEQYAQLRIAAAILRKQIEQHSGENQTPLLRHASEIFKTLTGGNFIGVRGERDERGQNMLMGLRNGGAPLSVSGMSDGTRDQLYLSLRLAHLQLYLDNDGNEPLPLVIDDVLVNFDDERCTAAFIVLHRLSARMQVVVFTHHRHIVDLAVRATGAGVCKKDTLKTLELYSFAPPANS